jgi:hypothetical protein
LLNGASLLKQSMTGLPGTSELLDELHTIGEGIVQHVKVLLTIFNPTPGVLFIFVVLGYVFASD